MKSLVIFFTLFATTAVFGQPIPKDKETGKFKYEQVIQAERLSSEDIYNRAKDWVIRTLKSGDNVVKLDDKDMQSITATGNLILEDQGGFPISYKNISVNFKLSIYIKEGRYKVIIDNFIIFYEEYTTEGTYSNRNSLEEGIKRKKKNEKVFEDAHQKFTQLIANLEAAVQQESELESDDW